MSERLEQARMTLRAVTGPEIPMVTVAELGILRDVQLDEDGSLVATITPTYPGCPTMEQIADDMSHVLQAADASAYRVRSMLSSAWITDRITAEGQRKLRNFGITLSAYMAKAGKAQPIRLTRPVQGEHATCPQCGSHDTMLIPASGSAVRKALYHCRAYHESSDYPKSY